MTAINVYATPAEFQDWTTPRGGQVNTDTADNASIELMLESVSRYIDQWTDRTFYPRYETRYFSVPADGRDLMLDDDLLAAVTVTNGDTNTIASTEWYYLPRNRQPRFAIVLEANSTYYWETNSAGEDEYVISVAGYWGYHDQYTQRGWYAASTIAEDLDISETAWDVANGKAYSPGQLVKVDNELSIIASISSNVLTVVQRGENGSTAAVHTSGATLYRWKPMESIRQATLLIAQSIYMSRTGQVGGGRMSVTASGVVIRPEDVPPSAQATLDKYVRLA
jgi:hypothetical protein